MNLKQPALLILIITSTLVVRAELSQFEQLKAKAMALDSAQQSVILLNNYLSKNDEVEQHQLADYYYLVSEQFFSQREYLKSLSFILKSRELVLEHENSLDLEYELDQLSAVINTEMNNYTEAQRQFELALNIAEAQENKVRIVYCLFNIGLCLNNQKKYDASTKILSKCNDMAKELGINDIVSSSLNELGWNSEKKGNLEKAVQLYHESGQVPDISEENIAISKLNIGNIRLIQGRYNEAIELYRKAENLIDETYLYTYIPLSNGIGKCYYQVGLYDSALTYLEKAFHLNIPTPNVMANRPIELKESFEYLELVAKAKNNENLLVDKGIMQKMARYNANLIANLEELKKINIQLTVQDHEKEVENKKLEKSNQKWITIAIGLLTLIFVSIVLIRYYTRKKRNTYKSLIKEIDETLINHA
ncbi:tetratricopeptide repeat protein [Reichenbachiella versicolor]|uniref:tetratricopeptide repeat protein n=1 Tax=Reichenbachiella versicolor TaxID=1821036 RepID=UPI000D6E23E4|nr:tetratricopeptide repeat protein [Reichenbachiella versicolor]